MAKLAVYLHDGQTLIFTSLTITNRGLVIGWKDGLEIMRMEPYEIARILPIE